ncbi:MAG TPA: peroxiredoxin [Rhodobacteraceae bacterium]|jgi:peroxiredoxin Q/BCP|nr:peroxiredoxin [Paracoccaceae bacterium]MBT6542555.1 peroxiredoxin [Paracoccaceae bacterium]HBS37102.1 peroxiredoxin [Paracoccaceae bacterium]
MSDLPKAAPTVALPRDGGTVLDISNLRPDWVVLFFYPRDDTSGCTKQALAFTALQADFAALNTQVIGISKDSVTSHDKFVTKYQLTIPLLSDESDTVSEAFGVWKEKSMYGKTYMGIERSTFLINADGQIVSEWRKVKVPGHVEAVLQALKDL